VFLRGAFQKCAQAHLAHLAWFNTGIMHALRVESRTVGTGVRQRFPGRGVGESLKSHVNSHIAGGLWRWEVGRLM